ncbi:hypothetical protein MKQ68_05485 [Chitinophaga horti]|uniref:Lipoprotein n=1 Tax=Chitinophaga horti TaxID=2920382 RepID=A0ABY6J4J0_9BACT|nr:hypothetical protein [Chitinophaga horti]UYQ94542.1 hypothetical protein MKQ68_05485 [Chitinophaga horti]
MKPAKNGLLVLSAFLLLSACKDPNQLKVLLGHGISLSKFRIELQTQDTLLRKVSFRRDSVAVIPDAPGRNEWRFFYRDSITASFPHIKTNGGDRHEYNFLVYEKDSLMMADIAIRGASPLDTTIVFQQVQR